MPPTRNTAHLHRANGKTACGRTRGLFTPNVLYVDGFAAALQARGQVVCKYCKLAYFKLPIRRER